MDAFGDFLKKLQLTQLLKLGKNSNSNNSENINYGTVTTIENNSQMLLEYGHDNNNETDILMDNVSDDNIIPTDNENESIFSDSSISEDAVWNYNHSLNNNNNNLMTSDGKVDILSNKLLKQIENIYYTREHLILYTVISLVKMLIILLYLSCLLMFFIIPSPNYWYLWTIIIDIFAFYLIIKAIKQIYLHNNNLNMNNINGKLDWMAYLNMNGL